MLLKDPPDNSSPGAEISVPVIRDIRRLDTILPARLILALYAQE